MADQMLYGHRLGVRDVPHRGHVVKFGGYSDPAGPTYLEPAEAAELGAALMAQAEEAVHASRARRRESAAPLAPVLPEDPSRCRSLRPGQLDRRCLADDGHDGSHSHTDCTW